MFNFTSCVQTIILWSNSQLRLLKSVSTQDGQKTKMSAATAMVIEMTHLEQHGKAVAEVGIKPKHQRNL